MKLSRDDSEENRISMLINLGDRECVVRLGSRGVLLPAFQARTVDFVPIKRVKSTKISKPVPKSEVTITPPKKKFEITPNINKLLKSDTLYFNNYYQSLGKGNTADAEFATLNSFYPVTEREAYRLYVENNYNGLPWLLRQQGYGTLAFHGNVRTFWNRGQMYPQEGFDFFYSQEYLNPTEISGFGITDKELFRQAVDILKQQTGQTFSFMVTVTNHIPYDLEDSLVSLKLKPEDETLFGHYLQAVNYADEAIGELIERLKEEG